MCVTAGLARFALISSEGSQPKLVANNLLNMTWGCAISTSVIHGDSIAAWVCAGLLWHAEDVAVSLASPRRRRALVLQAASAGADASPPLLIQLRRTPQS